MVKRKKETPFELLRNNLSPDDNALLDEFFHRVRCCLLLSYRDERRILADFENAFCYYLTHDVSVEEAIRRLHWEKLGDFYFCHRRDWYPLDSAGQIYPLSMSADRMAVFRLSFYLPDAVVPELLQMALNFAIKRFPVFATVLRRGFFWNYLEGVNRRWQITREQTIPCAPLRLTSNDDQAFRLMYYQERISAEFFHVLTDGTGGSIFLSTIAAEYLRLLGKDIPVGGLVYDINSDVPGEELEDTFARSDIRETEAAAISESAAVKLNGKLAPTNLAQVLKFTFSAQELLAAAKSHDATVTAFMTALMFMACHEASSGKGMLKIQVPINLRRFYPSQTLRNFSFYAVVRIPREQAGDFDFVLRQVKEQLAQAVEEKNIAAGLAVPNKIVRSVRAVPLALKRPCARIAYRLVGDKSLTNTLSNLGVLYIPAAMSQNLVAADFVLGTTVRSRAACTLITVNDAAVFTISKLTAHHGFEKAMASICEQMELHPDITYGPLYSGKVK